MDPHGQARWAAPARFFLVTAALLLLSLDGHSQYNFNTSCRQAYQAAFDLRFTDARRLISAERQADPGNLVPDYLDNFIDFLTLVIGEDRTLYNHFKTLKGDRIRLLEKGPRNSPYRNFLLGEVHLQWAIARVKFGDYAAAAMDIRAANACLEENEEHFPGFMVNRMGLGIIHVMASLVPERYRWVASLAGLEGSYDQGIREIRSVATYSGSDPDMVMFRDQASFFLVFLTLNMQKDRSEALSMAMHAPGRLYTSPLMIYAHASAMMRNGLSDRALALLQQRNGLAGSCPFYYLDFLEGMIRIDRLDTGAVFYFEKYASHFKGINYIRSARQKLAWISLLQGDTASYKVRIRLVQPASGPLPDEDRQAIKEATDGVIPNVTLLRARLLFDGGHYPKALSELLNTPVANILKSRRDLVEYDYRLGRIYHESGNPSKAVGYYRQAISLGKTDPWYYAAGAAYQLGLLYESKGDLTEAEKAYSLCLSIDPREYKNSLHQKAKAGLDRIRRAGAKT